MLPAPEVPHVTTYTLEPPAYTQSYGSRDVACLYENEEAMNNNNHDGMPAEETSPQTTAALRLAEDYPEPLTRKQRELLRRHTAMTVHRFETVRRGARIIERGYRSIHALLFRLEEERKRLQESLDDLIKQGEIHATTTTTTTTTTGNAEGVQSNATTSSRQPRGLLRSAAFANMHSILNAAKREEQQQRSNVTLEREKIGKTTRLKIIEDDIAEQRQHLALLTEKYEKSTAVFEVAKGKVLEALRLYDEMQKMEVMYPSRFFLRASGSQGNEESAENNNNNNNNSTASYDIFFTPAKYTEEVQDMIREQVEETLDEYLAYRSRVDPVLESLAEEQRLCEAKRADQLLQLIGVDTENMNVTASNDLSFATALVGHAASDMAPCALSRSGEGDGAVPCTTTTKNNNIDINISSTAAGQISDGEDDNGDDAVGSEPQETKQRDEIKSALALLDDFEELY